MVFYVDSEPDSLISVMPIYTIDSDLQGNQKLLLDFQVDYTRAPQVDSDGEEDLQNLETRTFHQSLEIDKDCLIGGDEDQILAVVHYILYLIEAPFYRYILRTLTEAILDLEKRLPNIERIKVMMDVIACRFPGEEYDDVDVDVNVKPAVAPASDEAVNAHLERVVVETEGYCVICMDKIQVGSDMAAARMPCLHMFHHKCGEEWLRTSAICPVCRAVFPSFS